MKKDKNKKIILETVVSSGTFMFFLQASLQGIISWISAHFFSKLWNKWWEKEKKEDEIIK